MKFAPQNLSCTDNTEQRKIQKRVSLTSIFLSVLIILIGTGASGLPDASRIHQAAKQKSETKKAEPEEKGPLRICLFASIYVPLNTNAIDNFVAYPYPFPPLSAETFKTDLPTDTSTVEELLKNELIAKKWMVNDVFLGQSYFLQTCFRDALFDCKLPRSGKLERESLDQVATALKIQLALSNKAEESRKQKYKQLLDFVSEEGDSLKAKSEAEGLSPVRIPITQIRHNLWQGCNWLGKGTWWLVGTHRLPNVTYYWQVMFSVPEYAGMKSGSPQYLQLTDKNVTAIIENH